jgi:hypothetical protein
VGERLGGEDSVSHRVRLYDPCCGLSRDLTLEYFAPRVIMSQYDREGRLFEHTFELTGGRVESERLWLARYASTREVPPMPR